MCSLLYHNNKRRYDTSNERRMKRTDTWVQKDPNTFTRQKPKKEQGKLFQREEDREFFLVWVCYVSVCEDLAWKSQVGRGVKSRFA